MTFEDYWKALNDKKPISDSVKLSKEQFKKMQEQAYKKGAADVRIKMNIGKLFNDTFDFSMFDFLKNK